MKRFLNKFNNTKMSLCGLFGFTSQASASANPPPMSRRTPHGNFACTVSQSRSGGTDLDELGASVPETFITKMNV